VGVALERHGEVNLSQAEWLILESQVLCSWSEQVRADARNLVARSRRIRLQRAGTVTRA
jgi:hypothetical protein